MLHDNVTWAERFGFRLGRRGRGKIKKEETERAEQTDEEKAEEEKEERSQH